MTNVKLNTKTAKIENEMPSITGVVTTAVLNTKPTEIENKILDITGIMTIIISDFSMFQKTFFHHKWNGSWLLVMKMVCANWLTNYGILRIDGIKA